jgi:hypothetical protein
MTTPHPIEATRRKFAQMKKQAEADRVKAMVARTADGSPDAETLFENNSDKRLVYSKRYFEWFCTHP